MVIKLIDWTYSYAPDRGICVSAMVLAAAFGKEVKPCR